jgi:hypothetical protein
MSLPLQFDRRVILLIGNLKVQKYKNGVSTFDKVFVQSFMQISLFFRTVDDDDDDNDNMSLYFL